MGDTISDTPRVDAFCKALYHEACSDAAGMGGREKSPEESYGMAVELARTLERELRSREWQPIETAPKDGKFLVLADHGLPWPASARNGDITSNAHGRVNDPKDRRSLTVTHWMPLPAPPTGAVP